MAFSFALLAVIIYPNTLHGIGDRNYELRTMNHELWRWVCLA